MKSISSRQNPWFKRMREAIRAHEDEIVIEGPKAVADAIAAGWKPIAVVVPSHHSAYSIPNPIVFSTELFQALTETRTPQNVIGLFERPRFKLKDLAVADSIIVALDGVQDPGNVGTIVRLAAAFDCSGVVVLPGTADAFSPKSIRASAGAILSVPVVECSVAELIDTGLPLFATDAGGASQQPPPRGAIVVFGNEGTGVSVEIRRVATPIAISMSDRVESLNVATAAAILLSNSYERRRS